MHRRFSRSPPPIRRTLKRLNGPKAKGQDQKLIGAYTEIIRLDPSSSVAYTNLGNIYVRLKDYNKGVSQYRAGIKATPEFELLHYNLGSRFSE